MSNAFFGMNVNILGPRKRIKYTEMAPDYYSCSRRANFLVVTPDAT